MDANETPAGDSEGRPNVFETVEVTRIKAADPGDLRWRSAFVRPIAAPVIEERTLDALLRGALQPLDSRESKSADPRLPVSSRAPKMSR